MTVSVRHLTARCPACGSPPRLRQTDFASARFKGAHPEEVVLTYQCHKELGPGMSCAHLYEIRVRHFVEAS